MIKYQASNPVKLLLQDLPRKGGLARSCKIMWDVARILQESCCKIPEIFPQDLARSCKILQECKKKDLFLKDLARAFLLGKAKSKTFC